MKSRSLLLILSLYIFFSCKSNDPIPPVENCQVTGSDNGTRETYGYDAKGMVKSIHHVEVNDFVFDVLLKRDDKGLLTESTWKFMPPDTNLVFNQKEIYKYTNGNITEVEIKEEQGLTIGFHRLKYDAKRNITEFTHEYGDTSTDSKVVNVFNEDGVIVLTEMQNMAGKALARYVVKPKGVNTRASENYLRDHGLPYGLAFATAYSFTDPGIGTTTEIFLPDEKGDLKLVSTLTQKSLVANLRGFTQQTTWTDDAGNDYKVVYSFGECK